MLATIKDESLAAAAIAEAALSHRHPLAGDVPAAEVILCRALIRGVPWKAALELAAKHRLSETRDAMVNATPENIQTTGFAPGVLRAAIFFVGSSDSFAMALERAMGFTGPENYCPVLVGSIGGARWGAGQISEQMLSHHPESLRRLLTEAADGLAARWILRHMSVVSHEKPTFSTEQAGTCLPQRRL